jgi:plasmid stabilization system protein ParE
VADVAFHPEAQAEFDAAFARYWDRSPRAAARFEAAVERALGNLTTHPEMYPAYDREHRFAVLRRYPYSLVYQVQASRVFVVAVAHASRSPGYWRGRS